MVTLSTIQEAQARRHKEGDVENLTSRNNCKNLKEKGVLPWRRDDSRHNTSQTLSSSEG